MFGVGSIPWSPLARGLLTRPLSEQKATTRAQSDPWIKGYGGSGTPEVINRSVIQLKILSKTYAIGLVL